MNGRLLATACVASLTTMLGGCVAAAIPVLASGTLVRGKLAEARAQNRGKADERGRQPRRPVGSQALDAPLPDTAQAASVPNSAPAATGTVLPDTMRYLYASGEAAALSEQTYSAMSAFVTGVAHDKASGTLRQMVLAEGSSLASPYFEPCDGKKPAIVLDVDETVLLNLGFEADAARTGVGYDAAKWARWEATGGTAVTPVPGAKEALNAVRKAGVTVLFNTNRGSDTAAATAATLNNAGLGPAVHGDTLFLKGDDGATGRTASGKDVRRWAIASGYCVVAMVGDQLGDFSDLFNDPAVSVSQRRTLAGSPRFAALWGHGWFLLPNPVYGPGVAGAFNDAFPPDKQWTDPGASGSAAGATKP